MPQLHPPLSGMPLAFISLLAALELCAWLPSVARMLPAARTLLLPAVALSCAAAFLSGYQASSAIADLSQEAEGALGSHHAIGRFVLINALLLPLFAWLSRIAQRGKGIFCSLYFVALAAQLGLTIWTGSLGGELVFAYKVGVSP